MRKYFLLSAVALLAATSANATTDYAEITAKATIEVANKYTCSELNFGTIVLKQDNQDSILTLDTDSLLGVASTTTGDILSVSGDLSLPECDGNISNEFPVDPSIPAIKLTDDAGQELTVSDLGVNGGEANITKATLFIPAGTRKGVFTGTFTLTFIE